MKNIVMCTLRRKLKTTIEAFEGVQKQFGVTVTLQTFFILTVTLHTKES